MAIAAILSFIFGGGNGTKISMFVLVGALGIVGTFVGLKMVEIHQLNNKVETLTKKNTKLTTDNTILIQNNGILKKNQEVLVTANQTNYETVKKLDIERAQAKAAIASLAAANQRKQDALNALNEKISMMAKDPKNDGTVSPVLRETIRSIQDGVAK